LGGVGRGRGVDRYWGWEGEIEEESEYLQE
jgi:hypothetical protein